MILEWFKLKFNWLLTYRDVLYLVKANKPQGKPHSGWIDSGEWKK